MALPWWKSKNEEGEEEVKLPPEIQEQLDRSKGLETKVTELQTKLSALDDITAYIREQREAARPKQQVRTQEEESEESEELAALLLSNPKEAYSRLASSTNAAVMQVRADAIRRETFGDNPEKFPYYAGEVKAEIDKILAKQTLAFQNNPEALENTYYTVVGKMHKEIQEGKIKDRFASSGGGRTTKVDEEGSRTRLESNEMVEKAAKTLGYSVKEYMEMLEKDAEAYI